MTMKFRIDIETEGHDVVLHVAGRLAGLATAEFSDACEPMEGHYVLDLSELMFADDVGAMAIRSLRAKGAEIRGASSFIKLLIDSTTG
jgi:anti-anti-sigma regulatory factor